MSFLINWINAIGALLIMLIVYMGVPEYSLPAAIAISVFALIFPFLSYWVRVKADPYLKYNPILAGMGAVVVPGIIGGAIYLAVQLWPEMGVGGKVFLGWLAVPALIMIAESVMSMFDDGQAKIENMVQ